MADVTFYFFNFLAGSILLLPLFHLFKRRVSRRVLFILAGVYLLYLIAPRIVFFYLGFWIAVWFMQFAWHGFGNLRVRSVLFACATVLVLSPMILWKLFPDVFFREVNLALHHFTWALWLRLGEMDAVRHALIPIGLSFNTFRAVDLLIQSHLDLLPRLRLLDVLFFGFFPPVMFIGPIIQYTDLEANAPSARPEPVSRSIALGLQKITVGLIKVYVLALPLAFSEQGLLYTNAQTFCWSRALVCFLVFPWYFYLNFAGFSDIAIGCARLYGYVLPENFHYPYFQSNLQRFWSCWHMSLTRFAQRNIFIALGGYRKTTQYLAISAAIMVIALWHDVSVELMVFGLWHGAGLCVTRYFGSRVSGASGPRSALRCAVAILGTYAYVAVSLPLVIQSLPWLLTFYKLLLLGGD